MFFCSKDVRLPVQLQRAMAAEAEAAREARAKVRLPGCRDAERVQRQVKTRVLPTKSQKSETERDARARG